MPTSSIVGSGTSIAEIERLYRADFRRYLRVAEAIAGDPWSGLDAVQEGFARALQHRSDFRGSARVSTWVWRCVINAAKAARARRDVTTTEDSANAIVNDESRYLTLREVIASLPARQRHVLFLRYYADLDYQAIADVLGIQLGTVGATLNKAHSTLRRQLEEAHDDQPR